MPPPDTLRIALAQLNPHEGQIDANLAQIRAARAQAAALGADLVVTPEFSIAGYPPEDLVRKAAFVADCEAALAELARDTADGGPGLIVGGPWRDGHAIYNAAFLLDGGQDHRPPRQARAAELRRVRRQARVRRRPRPGPGGVPRHTRGPDDLRGLVVSHRQRDAGRDGRRAPALYQRLPLRGGQIRPTRPARRLPRGGNRACLYLPQPGLRPGRAGVRRRQLRAQPGPQPGLRAPLLPAGAADHRMASPGRPVRLRPHAPAARTRAGRADLSRPLPRPGRLHRQEPLPRHPARPLRRHRLCPLGGHRRRCAGRGPRARHHAAQPLHQPAQPGRRRRMRPPARHTHRHRRPSRRQSTPRTPPSPRCSPACRTTPRRRTSSRARAASC